MQISTATPSRQRADADGRPFAGGTVQADAGTGERQIGEDMHKDILNELRHLRTFAHFLCRDHTLAEDLVQDTVVRALTYKHQFKPGTNLRGWLTTILRNRYFNQIRPCARPGLLQVELALHNASTSGGQEEKLEMRDFMRAFQSLPAIHREALLLVGAHGVSHEEAAKITNCAVGTIKSRVSRARRQLQQILEGNGARRAEPVPVSGASAALAG